MKVQENISPIEQYVIDFVRKLRIEKSSTQDDIANILELSRSYIGDIESPKARAKYNMTHINILADHFNLSPKDFFPQKPITDKVIRKEKIVSKGKEKLTKSTAKKKK
ncbi:MAG: helix-turn-helix transcriptional regulator [Ferruginibacter sp.]